VHFVDCMIAAAAVSHSLRVTTLDSDYKRFADVTVNLGEYGGSQGPGNK